jgi:cytochrome P450
MKIMRSCTLQLSLDSLAYHQMRLVLANVLLHFDLELCDTTEDWLNQESYTLWDKKPLFVKLRSVR